MPLDLEDIERENDNLSYADNGAGSGVHDGLACALAEGVVELVAVVLGEVIAHKGLTTVLVHSLQDLVGGSITKTGKEREEARADRGVGRLSEDDLVELCGRSDLKGGKRYQHTLTAIAPVALRSVKMRTLPWLLINRLAIVSTGWKMASSAIPAEPGQTSEDASRQKVANTGVRHGFVVRVGSIHQS